jgi:hypothetical protein
MFMRSPLYLLFPSVSGRMQMLETAAHPGDQTLFRFDWDSKLKILLRQ